MSVDMKVKAIYDSEISNITRSEKNWKDVLKVAGQLYRYEFDNIVMVTAQRSPEKSTLMADYDTWKKVGRYVKRGAKGCAIFPSRALNPRITSLCSESTALRLRQQTMIWLDIIRRWSRQGKRKITVLFHLLILWQYFSDVSEPTDRRFYE